MRLFKFTGALSTRSQIQCDIRTNQEQELSMPIAVKVPRSVQIRRLKEKHPYLDVDDIANLAGYPAHQVKAALTRGERAELSKTK
jgi:Fic family protein